MKAEGKNLYKTEDDKLFGGVVWLNAGVLGLSLGLMFGLIIFIATNWIAINGGENQGAHLRLLIQFFIGYSVSFQGSIIGFAYGFAVGSLSGALVAWIYNRFVMSRN